MSHNGFTRVSVRWYVGYDLDEPLPDHSILSKIRLRYGLSVFRRFFEAIVEHCQRAKLVWGRELYFDSTQVNANADLDSLTPRFAVEAREAIQEHLTALFPPGPAQLEQLEASSSEAVLPEDQREDHFCAGPTPLPVVLSEAQHEELATEKEFFNRLDRYFYSSIHRNASSTTPNYHIVGKGKKHSLVEASAPTAIPAVPVILVVYSSGSTCLCHADLCHACLCHVCLCHADLATCGGNRPVPNRESYALV